MSELATHAEGRKVVSRADAESVGEVKAFVLDETVHRIVALHVAGRERNAQLVDWDAVTGFGPDAVVIADDGALHKVSDDHERAMVRGDVPALGAMVIDDLGDRQGVVRDFRFDPGSGAIESIIGDEAEWTPDDVRALGSFALVVRHRRAGSP
jgi:uncharacterized protein YrrD